MKKILVIIFSFFMFDRPVWAISASSYVVMDMDNQRVLKGSNIHEERLIASITKIMTCIIAIEEGDLKEEITADKNILSAVGSSIYIEIGETLTLEDLLYGMMLRSGNDAATMIAINIAGSMEKFSEMMNKKAAELGMSNTNFVNSHGLEEGSKENKSSAYDMALLTSYAMQNKTFRKIFGTENYRAKSDKKSYSWANKNKLLKYDYVTGGKTGYTMKAKRTLVTTGSIDDKNVVIVTLNDPNDWEDHKNLYKDIKENYVKYQILDKDNFEIIDDVVYIEDTLYIKNDYHLIVANQDKNKFKIKYYLKSENKYTDGAKVGVANVYQNDELIHSEEIFIKIKKKKSFWSWLKNIFT